MSDYKLEILRKRIERLEIRYKSLKEERNQLKSDLKKLSMRVKQGLAEIDRGWQ